MTGALKTRPLFCAVIFAVICAGICSLFDISGIVTLLVSLVIFLSFVIVSKFTYKTVSVIAFVLAVILVLSILLFYIFCYKPAVSFSDEYIEAECVVLENHEKHITVFFTESSDGKQMNFKSRLYFADNVEDMHPSATLIVKAEFDDYSDISYVSGNIHASAFVSDYKVISEFSKTSVLYNYYKFRCALEEIISFEDTQLSAFVKGILLGDTDDVSGVFMNKFRTVGLSHVMSVSGLHLMFAVLFMDKLLILFGINHKKRAFIAIVSAFAFSFVSGFAVSCVRSFIMLVIYYVGIMIDKEHDGLTSLAISAYLILLFAPYCLTDISFVLSVLATFGMIALAPLIESLFEIEISSNRFILYFLYNTIVKSFAISLGANIACIPVFLIVFKQVSTISPLINLLLAIPIQIIFYLSFLIVLLFPFGFVKNLFTPILENIFEFVVKSVELCYNIKNITVNDGNKWFYFVFVVLFILVLGIAFLKRYSFQGSVYPYFIIYILICISLFLFYSISSNGLVKVKMIDVGQGSCTVIAKDEKAVVVDCGGDYKNHLLNELRYSNVKKIELLALTHSDFDHSGFLELILDTYSVDKIVIPDFADKEKLTDALVYADKQKTEIEYISKDCIFDVLDGCRIKAYVELAYKSKIDSNTSALYMFECFDTSFCFTGDMDINQEYVYLNYGSLLDCDVLSVSHHGSAYSSYDEILKLYSPEYSVISVSKNNIYGLPDKRIVSRLSEYSTVLTTAQESTVVFKINDKGYKLINQ